MKNSNKLLSTTFTLVSFLLISSSFSSYASLCGQDDRKPSQNLKVAKLVKEVKSLKGCSAALIGKNCLITAGHCRGHFKYAKFSTWNKTNIAENVYQLVKGSVYGHNDLYDHDWSVFNVQKNDITGKYPGEVGPSYQVDFSKPEVSTPVRVSGYGYSSNDLRYTQQTSTGIITKIDGEATVIYHNVDATHGNSGSGLINEENGKLIGVHFKGGCRKNNKGSNKATSIFYNQKLNKAISICLSGTFK